MVSCLCIISRRIRSQTKTCGLILTQIEAAQGRECGAGITSEQHSDRENEGLSLTVSPSGQLRTYFEPQFPHLQTLHRVASKVTEEHIASLPELGLELHAVMDERHERVASTEGVHVVPSLPLSNGLSGYFPVFAAVHTVVTRGKWNYRCY